MNTPAHAAINLAILASGKGSRHVSAVLAGSVIPDLPMIVFYGYEKWLRGLSETQIWSEAYDDPAWQAVFDGFSSIPLIAAGLALAYGLKHRAAVFFFSGMILHCLEDLLLHHDDAHRHLFPFSDWRFHSPVSYWDPRYHGHLAGILEACAVLFSCLLLARRFDSRQAKALIWGLVGVYFAFWGYALYVWGG